MSGSSPDLLPNIFGRFRPVLLYCASFMKLLHLYIFCQVLVKKNIFFTFQSFDASTVFRCPVTKITDFYLPCQALSTAPFIIFPGIFKKRQLRRRGYFLKSLIIDILLTIK